MKKLVYAFVLMTAICISMSSCGQKTSKPAAADSDSVSVDSDSTVLNDSLAAVSFDSTAAKQQK